MCRPLLFYAQAPEELIALQTPERVAPYSPDQRKRLAEQITWARMGRSRSSAGAGRLMAGGHRGGLLGWPLTWLESGVRSAG
jgi:hypothetical protein